MEKESLGWGVGGGEKKGWSGKMIEEGLRVIRRLWGL